MTSSGGRKEDSKKTRKAKAPAKASKNSSASTLPPKPAKAAANVSKPAEAASIVTTPVLSGSPNPTSASLEPQPSTSWADQAEHEDQDAAAGKAVLQHTPPK